MSKEGDPIRVLHVEDDHQFAETTAAFLEREGLQVTIETDSAAAPERATGGGFDCVISDYEMPGLDGLELLERVRRRRPALPFILFTGRGSEEIASDAISAGVTDYLEKRPGTEQFELLVNRVENYVVQQRAETALEHTEERYRQLVETSPMPICIYDGDGRLVYTNGATLTFLGADGRGEVVGRNVSEFVAADELPTVRRRIARVVEERTETTPREMPITTLDGEVRHAVVASAPVTFDGKTAGQVIVNDVTEHRRTQRELRLEQRLVDTALDALQDVFFVVDETGRPTRWNDRVEEVTGYSDTDLSAMTPADFFVDEHAEEVYEGIEEMLRTGETSIEADVLTKEGERHTYEFRGVRLEGTDGEVIGGCGIGRNVTERRERERELEQFRALVEAIGDPMYVIDPEGHLTWVNDPLLEQSGYTREELLGSHVLEFMDRADVERIGELIWSLAADPERTSGRVEFETTDAAGRHRVVEDSVALLSDEDGDLVGSVGVLHDVTEQRDREAALEHQNARLDEFASVVSHDLRNPLNVIDGYLDLARETGDPGHFDTIRNAVDRMNALIEDVLTLARHGRVVSDAEPLDVEAVARDAWDTVATDEATLRVVREGGERDADATAHADTADDTHADTADHAHVDDPDGDRPSVATVVGDRERLSALFENLFRNAVEHGGRDVTVTVTVDVDGFAVADDGPGIPPAEREQVLDHGFTTAADGTGFGLAIVREIVEAHGWSVTVDESPTGGARFAVTAS